MSDDRNNLRWGGVTIRYAIHPYLSTPFRFSTCVERTRTGLIHNEIGIITVVQNLIRMRNLKFPLAAIKPHTLYRAPIPDMLLGKSALSSDDSDSDDSSDNSSVLSSDDEDDDADDDGGPNVKYSVMAGPDMFDPKREMVVLIPSLISKELSKIDLDGLSALGAAQGGATGFPSLGGMTSSSSDPLGGGGGGGDSDDDGADGEPSTIFSHKEYDEGSYIKELEKKLKDMLVTLANERMLSTMVYSGVQAKAVWDTASRPAWEKLGMTFTGLNYASSRFSGGKVGEGERKMRKESAKCFENRQMLYCMFIDEIDTIGGDRNRKENEGYKTDYLNQLLAIIGQRNYQNLFVIGATNFKDKLDAALVRDGRLENHYYLPSMDKNRRLDHLSRKLSGAITSLVGKGVTVTSSDCRRVLESNKPVLGYLVRNTINFTFAQFDRLCSDIEGYLRIHFWARTMNTVAVLADWLPEIAEQGFKYNSGKLVLVAKDQMIKTCLDGTVKMAVDNYFKGNSMENLAYNRAALDTGAVSDLVNRYTREVKEFFTRETAYHSGVSPPTGRFIVNVSTEKSRFPEFIIELAKNPSLTNWSLFSEKRISLRNVFFNDGIVSKMIQPLVQSRGYEFIQIVDRETVQLEEEDKIYETLKAKYEEAATLAENGTAGLIIVRLNDLIGHIIQVLTTQTTTKTTREHREDWDMREVSRHRIRRENNEDEEKMSKELQIREAMEGSFHQSIAVTEESLQSCEERMENNLQSAETKSEKATEQERMTQNQEQSMRETDTHTERKAEFHTVIQKEVMRRAQDLVERSTSTMSMDNKVSFNLADDRTMTIDDKFSVTDTSGFNLSRDTNSTASTQKSLSKDDSFALQTQTLNDAGNSQKNSQNNATDTDLTNQAQAGNRNDSKGDQSLQNLQSMALQNQNMTQASNQFQNTSGLTLTDLSQGTGQHQHVLNNGTTDTQMQQQVATNQQQDGWSNGTQSQRQHVHQDQTLTTDQSGDNNTKTYYKGGDKVKSVQTLNPDGNDSTTTSNTGSSDISNITSNDSYQTQNVDKGTVGRNLQFNMYSSTGFDTWKIDDSQDATDSGIGSAPWRYATHSAGSQAASPIGAPDFTNRPDMSGANAGATSTADKLQDAASSAAGTVYGVAPPSDNPHVATPFPTANPTDNNVGQAKLVADALSPYSDGKTTTIATGQGLISSMTAGTKLDPNDDLKLTLPDITGGAPNSSNPLGFNDNTFTSTQTQRGNQVHTFTGDRGGGGAPDVSETNSTDDKSSNTVVNGGTNTNTGSKTGHDFELTHTNNNHMTGSGWMDQDTTNDTTTLSTIGNTMNSLSTNTTNSGQTQQADNLIGTNTTLDSHTGQNQTGTNQVDTNLQGNNFTTTDGRTNNNTMNNQNLQDAFGGQTDTRSVNNRTLQDRLVQNTIDHKGIDSKTKTSTTSNKLTNNQVQEFVLKRENQNLHSQQRTHGQSMAVKSTESNQMSHAVSNSVASAYELSGSESDTKEMTNESRDEGEMSKLLQLVADETIRGALNLEATKLLEQGLSEEYRQTMAGTMTHRQQLQQELKNEESQNNTQNNSDTTTSHMQKQLTKVKESMSEIIDKDIDELRRTVTTEYKEENIIKDEVLRPKIIDVISRFVGITSKYLNSFDVTKGPDILFVVEDDTTVEMLKLAIQWGRLKPSRPTHSMSVPDSFFTKYYDSILTTFWSDALSSGKIQNMKIILTAAEKDKRVGLRPFDFIPGFLNNLVPNRGTVAQCLKKIELEGCFAITDSMFYKKHATFLNYLPNLTTLRLLNMSVMGTVFQGHKRLKTETINLCCPNLVELELKGCRLPVRTINGVSTTNAMMYDFESVLCLLTGADSLRDVRMPKLRNIGLGYPQLPPLTKDRKHVFELPPTSRQLLSILTSVDLSRHLITWTVLEALLGEIGKNLRTLILENCIVTDFRYRVNEVNRFIERELPEELQGSLREPQKRIKRSADIQAPETGSDLYFINGHNIKPDVIYYMLVYWAEAKAASLNVPISFVGY